MMYQTLQAKITKKKPGNMREKGEYEKRPFHSMLRKHGYSTDPHLTDCLRAAVYMAILVYSIFHKDASKRSISPVSMLSLRSRFNLTRTTTHKPLWPSDLFYPGPENSVTQHQSLIFASPRSQNKNSLVCVYFSFAIRGISVFILPYSPALDKQKYVNASFEYTKFLFLDLHHRRPFTRRRGVSILPPQSSTSPYASESRYLFL